MPKRPAGEGWGEGGQLFDTIRQQWVTAYPEERIRQRLLQHMTEDLGYSQSLLAVEKELTLLPHLELRDPQTLPQRRVDLLCFAPGIHSDHVLYPLLMIECKAVPLTNKAWRQVVGYNEYVGAYFFAIANQSHLKMGWYDFHSREEKTIDFLPTYQELLIAVRGDG